MRSGWQKTSVGDLSKNQMKQMCLAVFGQDDFSHVEVLTAGRSHQNIKLTLANGIMVVLRVCDNVNNLEKQHALAQKLWQKLPVARFLSAPQQATGNKYFAFLEFRRGERLANIEVLSLVDQAQLGFEFGEYLALMHSQTFKHAGEFNSQLQIVENYDISPNGMADFFGAFIKAAVKVGRLSNVDGKKLAENFKQKIQVLNDWQHPNCLIHADLNEDNILHHEGHISAILDWEFTMSGHPAMDFGKFTRAPYVHCPIFLENLCDSYYLTHKSLPAKWDDIASIVDLLSWAEFLARPELADDVKNSALSKLNALLK